MEDSTAAAAQAFAARAAGRAASCAPATTARGAGVATRRWTGGRATARPGRAVQAAERQAVAATREAGALPVAVAAPPRRYLSRAGSPVQPGQGWREYELGTVYTTATRPARRHPGQEEVHAQELSCVGDVTGAAAFGRLLWCAAARRGALDAGEGGVVADGAHRIWNPVAGHFPGATRIGARYHASQYVWDVAHANHGAGTPRARRRAKRHRADLWEGRVDTVRKAGAAHRQRGRAVEEASTYYTNHRQRLRYAEYRARLAGRQRRGRERRQAGHHRPPA